MKLGMPQWQCLYCFVFIVTVIQKQKEKKREKAGVRDVLKIIWYI